MAFHPDPKYVQKFLKPLLIGELAASEPSQDRNKNVRPLNKVPQVYSAAFIVSR